MAVADVQKMITALAAEWRAQRAERQARRNLEQADFDALRATGLLTMVVPEEHGGLWRDASSSVRATCDLYRTLAAVDSSVALVSSMHPAVVAFWLASPDESQPDWSEQRRAVFASAMAGEQWGTITSEPGSGGDIGRTRSKAVPVAGDQFIPGHTYALTGDKHFGSGSGITDRMMTTGIAEGDDGPMIYVLDYGNRPWDGSEGITLVGEWDGMGMAATQSHAMRFESVPCVRMAWSGPLDQIVRAAGPFVSSLFTAVVLGVLDEAVALARSQISAKADQLRPYEQMEWARADQDHWLATQAYEGALRAIESGDAVAAQRAGLRAKESVAELAEQTLARITRVIGGGTFSRRSPFASWFEDVRALGFLRPPWGLAYDNLFSSSLEQT
jgi:alkylation response protein AidB-like acyl-CoA dehydrogenase